MLSPNYNETDIQIPTRPHGRTPRIQLFFVYGANYRRGLDSSILCKRLIGTVNKLRHRLSDSEKRLLIDDVYARVAHIASHVAQSNQSDLLTQLQTILRWDYVRLCQERAAFHAIYKPISILPPDQYLSVVLQAAEGCSWNKCTFCTFYRDRPFRVKCPTEFRVHIHVQGNSALHTQ